MGLKIENKTKKKGNGGKIVVVVVVEQASHQTVHIESDGRSFDRRYMMRITEGEGDGGVVVVVLIPLMVKTFRLGLPL